MRKGELEFNRYKTDINLTQYAAHLGYEIDRKKSTPSSIAMRRGGDKVIISRKGQKYVYFSVTNDGDRGTIIDFLQNRTSKSLKEIGQELQTWIGGCHKAPSPKDYVREVQEHIFDPERIKTVFRTCCPAAAHDYLQGRGLTVELLGSPCFKSRIFADKYGNAVFPHYNTRGLCGLELKNEGKALFVRGSEKTLWRSNITSYDNTLIIGEAVIDALSYAVLHPSDTAIYAATGGGMSPDQAEILKSFIQKTNQITKIILIPDNDAGGDKLAERLYQIIKDSGFTGEVTRHSPETKGQDWNDVLKVTWGRV